jgi:hypothetical protein
MIEYEVRRDLDEIWKFIREHSLAADRMGGTAAVDGAASRLG